ncbi:hypothetical protein [Maridesulfovibrio frigidus]|uniref:hypothetical protein n=1 Tax=Maridesulfovibrio frigidus TaxID=340956 RepID=UPI0004E0B36F|nr:hypothetical protein [Maridesulfovibrio frigidus]
MKNIMLFEIVDFLKKRQHLLHFGKKYRAAHLITYILIMVSFSGCAALNPFADSIPEYDLDGTHEMELVMMPGDSVAFDMRNPGSGGYLFDGVTFDPKLVSLEKYNILKADSGRLGDFGRWRFEFKLLKIGEAVVIINIKRANEDQRDSYKIVTLSITEEGEPFFEW